MYLFGKRCFTAIFSFAVNHSNAVTTNSNVAAEDFDSAAVHFDVFAEHFNPAAVHSNVAAEDFDSAAVHFDVVAEHFNPAAVHSNFNAATVHSMGEVVEVDVVYFIVVD